MGSVLERTQWVDRSIDFLIGDIVEYDMKDGGLSIIKEEKLLPQSMIDKLDEMKKGIDRNAAIGKLRYSKKYKDIPKMQNEFFKKYRLIFGEANELDDDDILAVRKDAIFTKKFCNVLDFGDYIHFAEKNHYQIYAATEFKGKSKIKLRLEYYWSSDMTLDVKGIDDDVLTKYHKQYTIDTISKILRRAYQYDFRGAIKYLAQFLTDYKNRSLDPEYYRTFDGDSIFPMFDQSGGITFRTDIGPEELPFVDISYNYMAVYQPLLALLSS